MCIFLRWPTLGIVKQQAGKIINLPSRKLNEAFNHLSPQTVKKNEFHGCKTTQRNYNS